MQDVSRPGFDAILPLYKPLQQRLLMIVRDPETAADLTQETFERALGAWETFDGREVQAWLFQIGVRVALNHQRRTKIWRRIRLQLGDPEVLQPVSEPDLWQALGTIRPLERAALILHVLDGYSYAEIGAMLEMSSGSVGSLISRGKVRLREQLEASHGR
jgi:RNA polymerase sigma-70 factor (ECF subfamily)